MNGRFKGNNILCLYLVIYKNFGKDVRSKKKWISNLKVIMYIEIICT